jgi:hypothetical protein
MKAQYTLPGVVRVFKRLHPVASIEYGTTVRVMKHFFGISMVRDLKDMRQLKVLIDR